MPAQRRVKFALEGAQRIETREDTLLSEPGYLAIVKPPLGPLAVGFLREQGAYVADEVETTNVFMTEYVADEFISPLEEFVEEAIAKKIRSLDSTQ